MAFMGTILGSSWVVISAVISSRIWVINMVTLLLTSLITTHEPPSRDHCREPRASF